MSFLYMYEIGIKFDFRGKSNSGTMRKFVYFLLKKSLRDETYKLLLPLYDLYGHILYSH